MLNERQFDLITQGFGDGAFPLQVDFREDDSQNSTLFVPTNQVRLALGHDNNFDRLPQNRFRSPIFQICVEKHQDKGFTRAFRTPALQRQHGMKDIL